MRLIETGTGKLVEFFGDNIPSFAILSHTWEDDEVTFKDWKKRDWKTDPNVATRKRGFFKIDKARNQAQADGLGYLWVDTACIDKRSSSELSEAINSMFSWYRRARICYAFLADVGRRPLFPSKNYDEQFCRSRWFTRGWTLQELLAPHEMMFFARDWSIIADRRELAEEISRTTTIPKDYILDGWRALSRASVAERMSWLSQRVTTRTEDMAYCMLGIFDINMPLLYGEGSKAFIRLQEEIIRTSTDHTIFCWTWTDMVPPGWASLLAPCPQAFTNSGGYVRAQHDSFDSLAFTMTNAGLSINLPILQAFSYQFAVLNATQVTNNRKRSDSFACVPIQGCWDAGHIQTRGVMRRKPFPAKPLLVHHSWAVCQLPLCIRSYPDPTSEVHAYFYRHSLRHSGHAFLLLFDDTHQLSGDQGPPVRPVRTHESMYFNSISLMERTQDTAGIEIFPDENFDRRKSLILLDDNYTTDGVLIRLGNHERSSVIFLGAKFDSSSAGLRRFGGVIPQSKLPMGPLGPKLLQSLLKHMRSRRKKVHWIRGTDALSDSSADGVDFSFGEELLFDDGSILPVFITYERGNPELNKDRDYEGAETDSDSNPEISSSRGQGRSIESESDIDFASDAAFAWMVG